MNGHELEFIWKTRDYEFTFCFLIPCALAVFNTQWNCIDVYRLLLLVDLK